MDKRLFIAVIIIYIGLAYSLGVFSDNYHTKEQEGRVIHQMDRTGQTMLFTPYLYDGSNDVSKAHHKIHGVLDMKHRRGFARWKTQELVCEIHAIRPKTIHDEAMMTVGHEVTHCIYGQWHD